MRKIMRDVATMAYFTILSRFCVGFALLGMLTLASTAVTCGRTGGSGLTYSAREPSPTHHRSVNDGAFGNVVFQISDAEHGEGVEYKVKR
jgi:hypothetical protein